MIPKINRSTTELNQFIWILLAIIVGSLFIAVPPEWVVIGGITIALFIFSVRSPLIAIILLMTLAPLRTLIATESAIGLPLDIGQLLFFWLLLSYSLWRIRNHQAIFSFLRINPILTALIIFLIATGMTGFVAWDMGSWLSEWLKWWVVALIMLIGNFIGRGEGWHWLVFAVVVSACANATIGIYIFFGGSGADHLVINDRFFRAFGTFGQPNPFGGFMGIVAPLALASTLGWATLAWRQHQTNTKNWMTSVFVALFYGGATGLIMIALLLSWSRGAWLSVVIALGAFIFALPHRWTNRLLLTGIAIALVAGFWGSGVLPASITSRIQSSTEELLVISDVRGVDITGENYAVIERLAHWQTAVAMAESNVLFGVGFGNYAMAYNDYRLINWDEPLGHAHNYYLNILAETGIIGTLAYLLLWIVILRTTWQTRHHVNYQVRIVMCGLFGSWVYILTHSLLDNLYVNNLFMHIGILLAVLTMQSRELTVFLNWGQNDTT